MRWSEGERTDILYAYEWQATDAGGPRLGAESGSLAMFELIIRTPAGEALKRFDLARLERTRGRVVIGRASDCDVRIAAGAISRHHCAIEPDEDDWIVRDLGSTHGVELEGAKIAQTRIVDGLKVSLGAAVLEFRASSLATPGGAGTHDRQRLDEPA